MIRLTLQRIRAPVFAAEKNIQLVGLKGFEGLGGDWHLQSTRSLSEHPYNNSDDIISKDEVIILRSML